MHECALYSNPELYDLLFPSAGDVARVIDPARRERLLASERFYMGHARGQVLELGCGSGRLTIPIARSGVNIVGIDLSDSMLETARAKAAAARVQVEFQRQDMRCFSRPEHFDTILIPGNSLLHLHSVANLRDCLGSIHRHLVPGGKLVFDVSKFDPVLLAQGDGRHESMRVNDPQRGEITIDEVCSYDAATQVRRVVLYLSTAGAKDFQTIEYVLRVIFPEELRLLVESVGFTLEARYGELTGEAFTAHSSRQVCVCVAA